MGRFGSGQTLVDIKSALNDIYADRRLSFFGFLDQSELYWSEELLDKLITLVDRFFPIELGDLKAEVERTYERVGIEKAATHIREEIIDDITTLIKDIKLELRNKSQSSKPVDSLNEDSWYKKPLGIVFLGLVITIIGGIFVVTFT